MSIGHRIPLFSAALSAAAVLVAAALLSVVLAAAAVDAAALLGAGAALDAAGAAAEPQPASMDTAIADESNTLITFFLIFLIPPFAIVMK